MKRQGVLLTLLGCAVLSVPLWSLAADDAKKDDDDTIKHENSVKEIGKRLAPVPLNLKGKKKDLVYRGSYIVNAQGGCNDCHTNPSYAPGGDPYRGEPTKINAAHYLAGGAQFGPFTSPNITPDSHGLPAGLTFQEFKQVMRTGHDPDEPGEILQVMPWPVYGNMIDSDLKAVYEYLRAIPHAEP